MEEENTMPRHYDNGIEKLYNAMTSEDTFKYAQDNSPTQVPSTEFPR